MIKPSNQQLQRIVSGGQTGADRAALDAAIDNGFATGGFCPKRRLAEDEIIPDRYPLTELPGGYRSRTRRNIQESDGTVVFYKSSLSGGTELTVALCLKEKKPLKLLDIAVIEPEIASAMLREFCEERGINILNVAGPRASKVPEIYVFVYEVIAELTRSGTGDVI